jgi:hypothetical protein
MNKEKTLFLCDDSPDAPFWLNRPEWDAAAWKGWRLVPISAPGRRRPWVDRFEAAINSKAPQGKIYVVTDAHFGSDEPAGLGGASLLKKLGTRLVRGVVFSRDPHLLSEQERSQTVKSVVNRNRADDADSIRLFLAGGQMDSAQELSSASRLLSTIVHDLENLAVPIRTDIEFLKEIAKEKRQDSMALLKSVWSGNLGSTSDAGAPGYLTLEQRFLSGAAGLECEVARLLELAAPLKCVKQSGALNGLLVEDRIDATKVAEYLNIGESRDGASRFAGGWKSGRSKEISDKARSLCDQIAPVADNIRKIAEDLAKIRNDEEHRTASNK